MMNHLKRAGKLKNLAGLIAGSFSDLKDNEIKFGKNIEEIILDAVAEYSYHVCLRFPAGHTSNNQPVLLGYPAQLDVNEKTVKLSYSL
jgi:muramoyltetrapeptide carboxypeptidase